MINAVANQVPCRLQIASLSDCPFRPSRAQVRNVQSWRLQGTPMTGLAENENDIDWPTFMVKSLITI